MKQILEGMLYLHSYGILHRDLTLANLLLTRDMDVVSRMIKFIKSNKIFEPLTLTPEDLCTKPHWFMFLSQAH